MIKKLDLGKIPPLEIELKEFNTLRDDIHRHFSREARKPITNEDATALALFIIAKYYNKE